MQKVEDFFTLLEKTIVFSSMQIQEKNMMQRPDKI